MVVGITSAHVFPTEKLSDVRVDPSYFRSDGSKQDKFVLLILEKDTGRIQILTLNQNRVTKVTIESNNATPELFLELASIFKRHKLSIIYSKHSWGNNLLLDVFLRDEDISPLVFDLEQLDGIKKMEILELLA